MGMTMTQKILAKHCGCETVAPGQLIEAKIDLAMCNDTTGPLALIAMEQAGLNQVFDPEKIVFMMDHFTPNRDLQSARNCAACRNFAKKHGIKHFYEGGCAGIEHAFLPESGLVAPGELVLGADSHTCTYGGLGVLSMGVGSTDFAAVMYCGKSWFKVPSAIRVNLTGKFRKNVSGKDLILYLIGKIGVDGARYKSLEFSGDGISQLAIEDRLTVCNMGIEAGAKNAIFPVDEVTLEYLNGRVSREFTPVLPDEDAEYETVLEIDLASIEPMVAAPHLPSNTKPASAFAGVEIHQAVIGCCTNGQIEDLRRAAHVLEGKKVAPYVRCIIIPATAKVYLQAMHEGLIDIFVNAGAIVSMPTCGPCNGGHIGVLADGERCVSTTNRNFVGRMGALNSEIYLASPAVAAASAVAGTIAVPED